MDAKRPPKKIFPKVSTLPRQRSEAAQYLDMYKLAIEKKRLQQELQQMQQRQQQIQRRLAEIDGQAQDLDDKTTVFNRSASGQVGSKQSQDRDLSYAPTSNVYVPERSSFSSGLAFDTVTLDY